METFTYKGIEGARLDRVIAQSLPDRSRTYCKQLIVEDCVTVNGTIVSKPSWPIKEGDTIGVSMPPAREIGALPLPKEDMGVRILFEHPDFLVVYKPAGLVVHAPHKNSTEVSLVDWLVHTYTTLSTTGPEDRPGIVHRLDKDTSGILLIARTNKAHMYFADLFQQRAIEKTYYAVVKGHPDRSGTIDLPIDRHRIQRHKMAVSNSGKPACTHYRVRAYYEDCTALELHPVTGRTHQIRVHCAALGHALLGDSTYGSTHLQIKRHALHAYQLAFWYEHRWYSFTYDMPPDMKRLEALQHPVQAADEAL